jgi:trehalose 6-phosphate phosphatase
MPAPRDRAAPLPPADPRWALFLDVDGTLLELADTPHGVRVPEGLTGLLAELESALGGAMGLVSGRSIEVLDRLFQPLALPAVGLHGAEWRGRSGGAIAHSGPPPSPALAEARESLNHFAARHPGVLVEDKGRSVALHYRLRPDAGPAAHAAARDAARHLGDGYHVLPGKRMLEIKPTGVDKGAGLRRAMREPPFAGRVPVFVGDDITDEDGFAAVNAMGGHSVRVGLDGNSAARHRLPDVPAVHDWLRSTARALTGGHGRS